MFIPSLSWQNDRFYTYMAQKVAFFSVQLQTAPWTRRFQRLKLKSDFDGWQVESHRHQFSSTGGR